MQDVLVRAQTLARWDESVETAARIAASFGGNLTGLHVVPLGLPPVTPYDPGLLAAAAALEARRQVQEAEGYADRFRAWALQMGAANPVWLASTGDAAAALEYVAGWHDLLVTRLDEGDDDPSANASGVGRIVVTTRLPTLVLPAACGVEEDFPTVAVAWNDSPGAARAIHAARPFLQRAERVVVLSGCRQTPQLRPAFRLQDWLQRHVPNAEVVDLGDIGDGGSQTGARLLDAADREKANLLVMGAYGHSRFSEWVLGGVTRHVLQCTSRPVLMRH